MARATTLTIGAITLDWSPWVPWLDILVDARSGVGVSIPNGVPGVYEVKYANHRGGERLHIGRASNLRFRVRQGLVKGRLVG